MPSKKSKKRRARAENRRKARRAAKRAKPKAGGSKNGGLVQLMPRSGADDGLFDDCPICQAMRDTGLGPDHSGMVTMTSEQRVAYERRLEQIVAEEGWPDGVVHMSGYELMRSFERVQQILEQEGRSTDPEAMDEQDLLDYLDRVAEIMRSLEREDALARSSGVEAMPN